jgi:hypothetical protein
VAEDALQESEKLAKDRAPSGDPRNNRQMSDSRGPLIIAE